jgi:hypothetical protein
MARLRTGKETEYVAPIFPVKVNANEQMKKPKKTMGIVSRAVKPRLMTVDTVLVSGGANISDASSALTTGDMWTMRGYYGREDAVRARDASRTASQGHLPLHQYDQYVTAPHVRSSGLMGSRSGFDQRGSLYTPCSIGTLLVVSIMDCSWLRIHDRHCCRTTLIDLPPV